MSECVYFSLSLCLSVSEFTSFMCPFVCDTWCVSLSLYLSVSEYTSYMCAFAIIHRGVTALVDASLILLQSSN